MKPRSKSIIYDTFAITLGLLAIAGSLALIGYSGNIDAWEAANGYPYGKLCDLYRNCK